MALFNKDDKAEKMQAKADALLEKYGLYDVNDPLTVKSLQSITANLAGTGAISFGVGLTGKAEDMAKINLLKALIEQNFIIIRQLDKLGK